MAQIHERQIYVMTFGLYFEVPAKKIEISKKSIYSVPIMVKNCENRRFGGISDQISGTDNGILIW